MAISYDEVLNIWGRKLLSDRGYQVSPNEAVTIELRTEGDGCCDECYSESAVIEISVKTRPVTAEYRRITISDYQFQDALLELVKISTES